MTTETLAAWSGVVGALLLALNVTYSPWAYPLFVLSSYLWIKWGWERDNAAELVLMNLVLLCIGLIGVCRWFIPFLYNSL